MEYIVGAAIVINMAVWGYAIDQRLKNINDTLWVIHNEFVLWMRDRD